LVRFRSGRTTRALDRPLGRRAVNLACPQARGRLNGLYTGLFFVGGAIGSALAGIAWVEAGWTLVCVVGLMFGVAALALGSIGRSADDATETVRNLGTIPRVRNPLQRRR